MADIPVDVLVRLNAGELQTATLVEGLAIDLALLLRTVAPEVGAGATARMDALRGAGITRRMAAAGAILLDRLGPAGFGRLAAHPADTARGWAAYLVAAIPDMPLTERLRMVRVLADDPHFGVREWAWLAVRPQIVADVDGAIAALQPWTGEPSANLRRFAVEATRPRGVWAAHIAALKQEPRLGLPLLAPVRADPSVYVQDSVANWLNDAGKSRPAWVRALCAEWRAADQSAATARICARATRNLA